MKSSHPTSRFHNYLELTKPRLNGLVVVTTLIGFCLASYGPLDFVKLFWLILGTMFVSGGSGVLNQYLERESDAKMKRTAHRPLPMGRIEPQNALIFGFYLSISGIFILAVGVNLLTSFLSFLALMIYLSAYTPLKSRTSLCTIVGAIPGGIPPMMGWTALRGELNFEAWLLFSILFLWQLPHFLSLAGIYREDYRAAGFLMLPVLDRDGKMTARQIVVYSLGLLLVSLLPSLEGIAGRYYFVGAFILGTFFLSLGVRCTMNLNEESKLVFYYRKLFKTSVIYLPLLLTLLIIDKV